MEKRYTPNHQQQNSEEIDDVNNGKNEKVDDEKSEDHDDITMECSNGV